MSERTTILEGCEVLPPLETEAERQRKVTKAKDRPRPKRKPKKAGNRFAVLNAFVDFTICGLGRSDIAVWLVLYRDTKDGIARTGQTDIARRAGVSRVTVSRAVGRLERRGLLVVVYRGGLNRGVSAYRVRQLERDR